MIFVDYLIITQRFGAEQNPNFGPVRPHIPVLAGVRRLSFREAGDIDQNGDVQTETEVIGESQSAAWLHGSHETRLQIKSDGSTLLAAGNPGRFGRPENIWNHDLVETVNKLNRIVQANGFPADAFRGGELLDYEQNNRVHSVLTMKRADEATEARFDGSRVWGIHLTQNYRTGSPSNLKQVINWLNTQSMARVTKKRRGESTLEFGSVSYCQTQMYDKAAEILAHCKSKDERDFLQGKLKGRKLDEFLDGVENEKSGVVAGKKSEEEVRALYAKRRAWEYAYENGLLRVEVKCAKDFLKHKGLTYLGAWDMGTVVEIFKERTEVLERLSVDVDELDIERLPKAVRKEAKMWLAGIDLTDRALIPESTYHRKRKILLSYGLDVSQRRDMAVVRPLMKQIEISPAQMPEWYSLNAA